MIFYCRNGVVVTTWDQGTGVHGGYEFCENAPITDGASISVHGTIFRPSQWKPELSTPRLAFSADLYVITVDNPL